MASKTETITEIMALISSEYPGRFEITVARAELWAQILPEFDAQTIRAATMHYLSEGHEFPPAVGQIRKECVNIKHGELRVISAPDAWVYVLAEIQKADGSFSNLSELTRQALRSVGTIFDLKRNENVGYERSHFIKTYNDLVEKQRVERVTLPSVKAVVGQNVPQLPAPPVVDPPRIADPNDDNRMLSDEERDEMIGSTIEDLTKAYDIDRNRGLD